MNFALLKPLWICYIFFQLYTPRLSIHTHLPSYAVCKLWLDILNTVFYLICGLFKPYVFLFSRCAKQMGWQNNRQWRCRRKGKWRSRIVPAPPRRVTTTGVPGATSWTFSCQWLAIRWAFLTSGGFLTCA